MAGKTLLNENLNAIVEKHVSDIAVLPEEVKKLLADISGHFNKYEGFELIRTQYPDNNIQQPAQHAGNTPAERQELLFQSTDQNIELKRLLENIHDVFFSVDMAAYRCTVITPACSQVYGYPPHDFYHNASLWFDLVLEEDKHIIRQNDPILKAGHSVEQEYRIRHGDGSTRWLRSKMEPTLDAAGKIIRIDGITSDITQRKEAEIALKQSEQRFRSLLENSSDAIMLLNEKGEFVYVSESVYRITGYAPNEISGMSSFGFVHPEDVQPLQAVMQNAIAHPGKPFNGTYRRLKKDGSYIWCEGIATSFLNEPAVNGIVVNFNDVTERVEAEQALKKSEYKFRSLIEHNSDVIMVLNEQGEIVYASDSLYRVLGYKPEEVLGVVSLEYVYPDDLPALNEHTRQVRENPGKPFRIRYRRTKKDGGYIWCEGTAINLLHEPAVNGTVVNFNDVSERVEAEMALKESEYKFRSLIKNSSDAITVVNKNFEVLFASDSLYTITGYTPEEVKGMSFADFVHPEDLNELRAFFNCLLEKPAQPLRTVYRSRRKDGAYIWLERIATNWLNDPIINGIVSNYRDVTERRKYLETIQASNENLRKSNQELDRFVYSVSHDLRAPLASVLGILNIIDAEKSAPLIAEELGLIKDSVKKLDGFILDILDYSKNSRMILKKDQINFKDNLNTIINNLRYMADGVANTDIKFQVTGDQPFYSDLSRINIVLNNLISNAVRYQDSNKLMHSIDIRVNLFEEWAAITITDNGIGIPEDKHEKIFEMFYRLSKQSVGSGLGLYIVKETVQKLNGSITLKSEPGKGTEITILLPNLIKEIIR